MAEAGTSPTGRDGETGWWRDAVVYQIYMRSFADGDGDGIGDIAGVRSRLDYLEQLGVDAIWFTPWYLSPLADGGYDAADYRQIDPRFGSVADAEALIRDCHARGIKVIADLVPNHTSVDHAWFREALAAQPGDPARDRYWFRPGKGAEGAEPPTNWRAVFGGSTWERLPDGDWYLHIFDVSQPDLNWANEEVRAEFDEIIRFWLDRGIDGLRIDVAHGMVKDPELPDVDELDLAFSLLDKDPNVPHPFWDRRGVHEINRRWRSILDEYDDRMMVAEAWINPLRLPDYLRADEYHQSFNFSLLETPWDAVAFRESIGPVVEAAAESGSSCTWVLSNHDVMRHATRYGLPNDVDWRKWPMTGPTQLLDAELGQRRARAAVLITLGLPGSTYLYQGEELGLPEAWDLPFDVLDDPTWERSSHTEKGRDGCRVPIPWKRDGQALGFSDQSPWLPQPASYAEHSVEAQAEAGDSMLALYREAIAARRHFFSSDEAFHLLEFGPGVLAWQRGDTVVVANMSDRAVPLPPGEVVLASSPEGLTDTLPPDTAAWLRSR